MHPANYNICVHCNLTCSTDIDRCHSINVQVCPILHMCIGQVAITYCRSLWNFATFVHINLCATLFIAHLLLILICLIADKVRHITLLATVFNGLFTGRLCHSGHFDTLFLPCFIHVVINGGSCVVYNTDEGI